ncbi:MAG: hypothetical protein LLG05_02745 [Porphyromonadaceae bacterium]|nr:hypothetical protein [uncultured Macellibacteroides sp.]MCE5224754.1 hypothetical protein [Porphyromonadaceae bacterium]
MRKKLFYLCLLAFVCFNVSAQDAALTNKTLLEMVETGFSDDVIIAKIKTSDTNFDTSLDAIKMLKGKGISDNVLVAVMNNKDKTDSKNIAVTDSKTGIFYLADKNPVKLLPSVFSGTKTNTLGANFSYGIASAKVKSVINKGQSANVIYSFSPEFMFYFARKSNDFAIGASNWWFAAATSPNEFVLVKLKAKKNSREMVTGKVNVYSGSNLGVDEKSIIPFTITAIDDFTYKVVPNAQLYPGEYCFFYQGTIPQGGFTNQSVFDFSIQ